MADFDIIFNRPRVWDKFFQGSSLTPEQQDEIVRRFQEQILQDREFENWAVVMLDRLEAILRDHEERLDALEGLVLGNLVHVSWYGAAHQSPDKMREDMDTLVSKGYNGARVWATWAYADVPQETYSPITFNGEVNEERMSGLREFIIEARSRAWTVDVTLSQAKLNGIIAHKAAIEVLVEYIGDLDNWYLDICNEAEKASYGIVELYEFARGRLGVQLTTSYSGDENSIGDNYKSDLDDGAAYDLLTPHFPRDGGWTDPTSRIGTVASLTGQSAGTIHLQEPNCVGGGGVDPSNPDNWYDFAKNARTAGARGVCFHTIAGFSLKESGSSLIDNLAGVEVTGIDRLVDGWVEG